MLGIAAKILLESWMTTTRCVWGGVAEKIHRVDSLCFRLRQIPGEFHIYYRKDKEAALMVDGQGARLRPGALTRCEWPISMNLTRHSRR
jgi:hypothetical protein